jgi:hypothetical protein
VGAPVTGLKGVNCRPLGPGPTPGGKRLPLQRQPSPPPAPAARALPPARRVCRRELHGAARASVVERMRAAGAARGIALVKVLLVTIWGVAPPSFARPRRQAQLRARARARLA